MRPVNIQHESLRSDQPSIIFETNNIQGVQNSGYATLVLEMLQPNMEISINNNSVVVNDASRISIMIAGDRGAEGLAIALLELGWQLLLSKSK